MMYRFRLTRSPAVSMAEFSSDDLRSTTRSSFSMRTAIFPILLIALDLSASVVYAVALDWRRALYWLAAAVLTACVTF
jgi:hypothetical protein